mmetsp:Transcript_30059/g.75511  ORF Transcript_30059/g.75511 Transcript_30059/m.75511 type:complete len:436 (+) Transcript_30059:559-1866(+)
MVDTRERPSGSCVNSSMSSMVPNPTLGPSNMPNSWRPESRQRRIISRYLGSKTCSWQRTAGNPSEQMKMGTVAVHEPSVSASGPSSAAASLERTCAARAAASVGRWKASSDSSSRQTANCNEPCACIFRDLLASSRARKLMKARKEPRSCRHSGHLAGASKAWSSARERQERQRTCPHGRAEGKCSCSTHSAHSTPSRHASTVCAGTTAAASAAARACASSLSTAAASVCGRCVYASSARASARISRKPVSSAPIETQSSFGSAARLAARAKAAAASRNAPSDCASGSRCARCTATSVASVASALAGFAPCALSAVPNRKSALDHIRDPTAERRAASTASRVAPCASPRRRRAALRLQSSTASTACESAAVYTAHASSSRPAPKSSLPSCRSCAARWPAGNHTRERLSSVVLIALPNPTSSPTAFCRSLGTQARQ